MIFKKTTSRRMHSAVIPPPARPRQPPMNQALVDLGKAYQLKSPELLGPGINEARDFFINVIAPKITALDNGLQDGVEVLRLAMGEEPQAGKYFHTLKAMMDQALQVRMSSFIAKQCELSDKEHELFISLALGNREKEKTIADLIRELGSDSKTPLGNTEDQRPGPNLRQQKRNHMAMLNRETEQKLRSGG